MSGPTGTQRPSIHPAAPAVHGLLGLPLAPQRAAPPFDPERANMELLESLYRSEALVASPSPSPMPSPERPRTPETHGVRTSAAGRHPVKSQTESIPSASGLAERARGVTKTLSELVDTAREAPVTTGAAVARTVAFFAAPLWIPATAGIVAAVGTGLVLLSIGQVAFYETRALLTDQATEHTHALEQSGAAALGVIAGLPAAKGSKIAR